MRTLADEVLAVLRRIFDDGTEPDPRLRADLLERLTARGEGSLIRVWDTSLLQATLLLDLGWRGWPWPGTGCCSRFGVRAQ